MMKKYIALLILGILVLLPGRVMAKSDTGNGVGQEKKLEVGKNRLTPSPTRNEDQDEEDNRESTGSANRSDNAREHMSIVASEVEKLLLNKSEMGGIGEQVREIAQSQNESRKETENNLDQLEKRPGWLKKLFGSDQRTITNIEKQIEQNQLRIEQLTKLQLQLENQADKDQVNALIQAIVNQNTALQESINSERQVNGWFGWLINLF